MGRGVPRYWELAADYRELDQAVRRLVLSPLGVLYEEPLRLLLDDWRELTQASTILALIGAGAHRLSEIAGRLGKPATSLGRPLARLIDLGLVRRDVPFGESPRRGKRTAYRITDPFLRFWFRFVEPNRSRLEARALDEVARDVRVAMPGHVAGVWEDLVRESVPRARYLGWDWGPAGSWWGPGRDRRPMELDVVASSSDGRTLLVGEVRWSERLDWPRDVAELRRKAGNLPLADGKEVRLAIWHKRPPSRVPEGVACYGPREVLAALT